MINVIDSVVLNGGQYDSVDITDLDFDDWVPTFPQMRDRLLRRVISGPAHTGHKDIDKYSATVNEIDAINTAAIKAVQTGRVIDFGFIPNGVVMSCSARGAALYALDAAPMPFGEPYLLLHKWEGQLKGRPQIALYLVNPLEPETPCGDFEIVDLQPIMINGNKIFLYGDRATFFAKEAARDKNYACSVVPSVWRIMPGNEAMNNGNRPENAAASNVLDPIMTMLLILNTRNVKRETIRVADKLNKSRVRSGKPMIPPYDVVNAAPYVTAILAAGTAMASRDAAKGGTHASPIPHIRQGHMRHYPSGRRTFIAETLVNVAPEAREGFLSKRSHYEVKQ